MRRGPPHLGPLVAHPIRSEAPSPKFVQHERYAIGGRARAGRPTNNRAFGRRSIGQRRACRTGHADEIGRDAAAETGQV